MVIQAFVAHPFEPEHRAEACIGTQGEEELDRGVLQPAHREADGKGGRWVEPLDVVDGHEDGPCLGKGPKGIQNGDTDDVILGVLALGLLAQQRHAQGPPLGRRQVHEDVIADGLEEIAEARVGERRLGIGRLRLKHPARSIAGPLDRGLPQGRLAHPGLAIDEQDRPSASFG